MIKNWMFWAVIVGLVVVAVVYIDKYNKAKAANGQLSSKLLATSTNDNSGFLGDMLNPDENASMTA